jgi:hypothetical protein
MNMDGFTKFKDKISTELRASQEFLDMMFNIKNASPDESEIDKVLHKFNFAPNVESTDNTHVCFETIISEVKNDSICSIDVYFWVFVNQNAITIDKSLGVDGDRRDNLCRIIDTVMNGRWMGAGKTHLIPPMGFDNFGEYVIKKFKYRITDLNNNVNVIKR